jgi:hypothetical protein
MDLASTQIIRKKPICCKMFDVSLNVIAFRNIILKSIGESESLRIGTSGEVLWTRK